MIKQIKKLAKRQNKKIGKKSIEKIISALNKEIEEIIKKAARNAGFSARKTIKPEDIEEKKEERFLNSE